MNEYINLENDKYDKKLKEAAEIIKKGEIVVFPTETVYGIGTNGFDEEAIKKLYRIKNRPLNKPISLLVSDFEMMERVAKNITDIEYKIMKEFFPGPLTIILKKKNIVPDILTNGEETVGIRMPNYKITKKLIEYVGSPIATTSANISGKESGTNLNNIKKEFKEKVKCFIDDIEDKSGISSTVVKVEKNNIIILREGTIKKEDIEKRIFM